jgi:hypothetical protein
MHPQKLGHKISILDGPELLWVYFDGNIAGCARIGILSKYMHTTSIRIFFLNETNHFGHTGNVSSHFTVLDSSTEQQKEQKKKRISK